MKRAIYIPGLGHERMDLSVKAYASRMMKAIDENRENGKKTYRLEASERNYDTDGTIASVVSIFEMNEEVEKEVYRFYEFQYGSFLTERFDQANVFFKFITLLLVLLSRFKSVLFSLFSFKDEVNKVSKVQVLYFTLLYVLLALYLITLLPALVVMLASFAEELEQLKFLKNYDLEVKGILASFSAFMLFSPGSQALLSTMASEYLAANQYLSFGEQRLLIMGKLSRLIEVVAEEEGEAELDIEIHAYSFGTVLAVDAVFPYESEASRRIQTKLTRLLTIGFPFDFIEIYWRNYFSERNVSGLSLKAWDNVNCDMDVLSSKFSNRPVKQKKFIDSDAFWKRFDDIDVLYNIVNPKQVSFMQYILLYGLRAHQMYWDKHVDAKSCLFKVVRRRSGKV